MTVNLFIAGWPKTGSTSLNDYIEQHPDAIVANKKDSYFFCKDLKASSVDFHGSNKFHFIETLSAYESMFNHYKDEKVICESSVFYAVSQTAAKSMYEYNPNARIVLILREPLEMLESWFNYLKVHSRESAKTLKEALSLEEARKNDKELIPKEVTIPEHVFYTSLVNYYEGIEKFFKLFGKNNVKIILTDELKEDTISVVQNIYKFAGIDHLFEPSVELKNVTFASKNTKIKKLIDTYLYPLKRGANRLLSGKLRQIFKSFYRNLFFRKTRAQKNTPDEVYSSLYPKIKEMLTLTSKLIDIDLLEKWNYN